MPPRKRAAATQLSVVDPDAPAPAEAPKKKPLTLAEAIEDGNYLEILRAQRRQLVDDMKGAAGPAKAAMHRQLALLSKEIAALEAEAAKEAGEDAESDAPDEEFDPEAL